MVSPLSKGTRSLGWILGLVLAVGASAQPADPLGDVADRLGGRERFDALSAVRVTSRADVRLGAETIRTRSTLIAQIPGRARWDVHVGGRTRRVELESGRATSGSGDGRTALPDSVAHALDISLWLDPLMLMARREEVRAEALSETLIQVEVPGSGEPILVGLDALGRPARLTTFLNWGGRREYVAVQWSDYREVGALSLPFRAVQTVAGVKTGTTVIERIDLDPADGLDSD